MTFERLNVDHALICVYLCCVCVLLTFTEFIPEADSGYSAELVIAVTLQSLHNTSTTQQHQQHSSSNNSSAIDYEGLSALECFDSTVLLAPDETHQYTYRVKRYVSTADSSSSTSAVQEQILSKGAHTLGHIELAWRTTLGECGAVSSGPIQCDVTQQGGVYVALYTMSAQHTAAAAAVTTTNSTEKHQQLQLLAVDTPLQLGKVASCVAAVSNLTDKPMYLQLQFRTENMIGVYVHGRSFRYKCTTCYILYFEVYAMCI
jgi:Protein of unknown function (DUF974)